MAYLRSTSSSSRWKFDVFLSFRGEDTRKIFVDPLCAALQRKGIYTFKDDEKLERGKSISPELLKAIEESRFVIVVFSRDFASSSWCLDELVKILECKNTGGQIVFPIFHCVDQSDVREHRGSFGEAFARHEKVFKDEIYKVKNWKEAMADLANLPGWNLPNTENGHDLKLIQEVVEKISRLLRRKSLHVAEYQVGLDSRAKEVLLKLSGSELQGVSIVGICGINGIGKTTLAKLVFNEISDKYESSCFLANVSEASKQHGIAYLQEELLRETTLLTNTKVGEVERGKDLIKQRLQQIRVLVVLDDVDQLEQLEGLVGKYDWFGPGSTIIVTSRDENLLRLHEAVKIYNPKPLTEGEALELFSWHAFRENYPLEDYVELSHHIVDFAKGVPLTLELLGSFLYDKKSIMEWRSAVDKLRSKGYISGYCKLPQRG